MDGILKIPIQQTTISLRVKTLALVGAILIALIVLSSLFARVILLQSFTDLEAQRVDRNVWRVIHALNRDLDAQAAVNADWAYWDDSYEFVQDGNDEFITTNLPDETFEILTLNVIVYVDTAGQPVYAKAYDLEAGEAVALPAGVDEHFFDNPLFTALAGPGDEVRGVVVLPGGPMMVTARAILPSDEQGASQGTLIFGRYLSDDQVTAIGEETYAALDIRRYDDAALPDEYADARTRLDGFADSLAVPAREHHVERATHDDVMTGYTLLADIYGDPALLLRIGVERDMYAQGQETVVFFLLALAGGGLVLVGMALLVIERLVLARLLKMNAVVRGIGQTGDITARVPVSGGDEVTHLATGINTMLANLEDSQQGLRERETRYRTLFENAHDAIFTMRGDTFIDCNPRTLAMFRCTRDQIVGQPPYRFSPPTQPDGRDSQVKARELIRLAFEGTPQTFDWRHTRLDGTEFDAEVSLARVELSGDVLLQAIVHDITERKRAEDALAAERNLLRTIIDHVPATIYVKDRAGTILLTNVADMQIRGATRVEDVVGKTDRDFYAPEFAARYEADDAQVVQAGESVINREEPVTGIDQPTRWLLTTKVPLRDSRGAITGLVGIGANITEWRQAQEALRESEERLELALQGAGLGSWDWDVSTNRVISNARWYEMLGYEPGEVDVDYEGWTQMLHPDDVPHVLGGLDSHLAGHTPFYEGEYRLKSRTGDWVWILDRGKVVRRTPEGEPLRVAGTHLDITARKRAEAERERLLQQTRTRAAELATVAEVSRQATTILDVDRLLWTVSELIKVNFDLYHVHIYLLDSSAEQLSLVAGAGAIGRQLVAEGISIPLSYTHSLVARAARTRAPVVVNDVTQVDDFLGHPLLPDTRSEIAIPMIVGERVLGVVNVEDVVVDRFSEEDIAVQSTLAAQVAIAIHNARLFTDNARRLAIIESSDSLVALADYTAPTLELSYANPAGLRMLGYERLEDIGDRAVSAFYPPESLKRLRREVVPAVLRDGSWHGENTLRRADGSLLPVEQTVFVIRDDQGQPRDLATIVVDITERKQAEEELRRSEERLELALQGAELGMWDWNIQTGEVVFNERWAEVIGYTLEEVGTRAGTWERLVHPDDSPRVMAELEDHLAGRTPFFESEYRLQTKTGNWRWILDRGKVMWRAEDGSPLRMAGTHLDITERRQAEDALRKANRAYRALSDCNQAMVRAVDEQSLLEEVCDIVVRAGGYRMAWVAMAGDGAGGAVRPAASAGHVAGYLDTLFSLDCNGDWQQGPTATAIRSGDPYIVRDISSDPVYDCWRDEALSREYHAMVALPLIDAGRVLGALNVYTVDPYAFDTEEIALLVELASDLAYGLGVLHVRAERRAADELLRRSEANLSALIENTEESIFSVDRELVVITSNSRFQDVFGTAFGVPFLPGTRALAALPDDIRTDWQALYARAFEGERFSVERRYDLRTIGQVDVAIAFNPIRSGAGEISGVTVFITDVSQRKRDEEALHQLNARLEKRNRELLALYELGHRLTGMLDVHDIYRLMYEEIAQGLLGTPNFLVALYDEADAQIVCDFAVIDGAEEDAGSFPPMPLGDGPNSQVILTREPRIVALPEHEAKGAFVHTGDGRTPRSLLYMPLISGNQVIGVFNVQHYEPDAFEDVDLTLLTTLANQAASALQNARLFAAEREQRLLAEALSDTAAAINRTLDFDRLIGRILDNLKLVIHHTTANIMLLEGDNIRVVGHHGYDQRGLEDWIEGLTRPVDQLANLQQILVTRRPIVIADTRDANGWAVAEQSQWVRSYASAPLLREDRVIGFLNLYSETPGYFSEKHGARLQSFANQAAIALQNARLFADEREQRTFAEALTDTATAINQSLDPDEVMDRILENVKRVVPHDSASIMLIKEGVANIVRHVGFAERGLVEQVMAVRFDVSESEKFQRMAESGRPVRVLDTHTSPDWDPIDDLNWIRSYVGAPIRHGDRLIGVLNLDSADLGFFTETHAERLQAFADQAAIALRNAQLFTDEREQRTFAEALRETAAVINLTLEPEDVLKSILQNIKRVVPNDAANIMLIEGQTARVVGGIGYDERGLGEWVRSLSFDVTDNRLLREIVATGRPIVVADTATTPGWQDLPETEWLHSYACAPIRRDDRVIGFLNVYSTLAGFYTASHAERLQAFAYQAANAIRNAQLFTAERNQRAMAEALRDTAAAINRTLDPDTVLDRILENIRRVIPHDAANIMFIEEGVARVVRSMGYEAFDADTPINDIRVAVSDMPHWQTMIETGQPFTIPDTAADERWLLHVGSHEFAETWIRSTVKAPIRIEGKGIGIVHLDSATAGAFSSADAEKLQAFADQAAIAIHNAQLFSAERDQRALAEALHNTAATINHTLDLDEVLEQILTNVWRVVPNDSASIMFVDERDNQAYVVADWNFDAHGMGGAWRDNVRLSVVDVPNLRRAVATRRPVIISDTAQAEGWVVMQETSWIRSHATVPILRDGQVLGFLMLDSGTPGFFGAAHVEPLRAFADHAAIAIQNAQLFTAERNQRAMAEALRDTAAAINRTLNFDEVLDLILDNTGRVVPHDAANVMLIEDGIARVVRGHGYAEHGVQEWVHDLRFVVADVPIWHQMFASGQPFAVPDTQQDPDWLKLPEEAWIRSTVKAPIRVEGRIIGILHLDSATPGTFSQVHADRLQAFADQAAVALRNAQFFAAERDQRTLAEALRDTAAAVNSTLDFDTVLDRILTNVGRVAPYDVANIMLIEGDEAHVVRRYPLPETALPAVDAIRFTISEIPNLRRMVETGEPIVVPEASADGGWVEMQQSAWIRSHAAAPIRRDTHVIGFVMLDAHTPDFFTQAHAERLQVFADQVSVAIYNAQLFEAVQRHAAELEQRVHERTVELEQRRGQLQAILDSIGEGVIYDEKLETKYTNRALTDLTGFESGEFAGYLNLLRSGQYTPAEFEALERKVFDAVSERGIWRGELRLRRKEGSEFDAALTATQVRNTEGDIVGAVTVIRDVSQEKALQEQKDRFIASASHELRTPLANVKTRLYLLRKQPEKAEQHYGILDRVTSNMAELIENLLDVSRFERGVIPLYRRDVALQDIIRDVVAIQYAEAERKNIALEADLAAEPVRASVDPQRIAQVVTNLINNAINYTPDGGTVTVDLALDESESGPRAVMRVRDTGIGISAENLSQVFEPFFRANEESAIGTGLGLTIAREIVRLHGGDVVVESELGRGSVFTVTIDL